MADSICEQLNKYKEHFFVVVFSKFLNSTKERIKDFDNVEIFNYDVPDTFQSVVLGRDRFLDDIVVKKKINAVLTIFGPSRWIPRVPHLSGFALAQLVTPESPYFQRMSSIERIEWKLWCRVRKWSLKRSADAFWTENPFISERLKTLLKTQFVYTVSNYYNQVFDNPEKWKQRIKLPSFEGITCLSISSPAEHKNFGIIEGIVHYLRDVHPDFKIRFVLTFSPMNLPMAKDLCDNILYVGKVDVTECPSLYRQADIMFMPSLLECFTATYPEAMRMNVPIVTTDLEFARGLCGNAACYYSAVDAKSAADAIYTVATDKAYRSELIANGQEQLKEFDNYEQRADKLITILETIAKQ